MLKIKSSALFIAASLIVSAHSNNVYGQDDFTVGVFYSFQDIEHDNPRIGSLNLSAVGVNLAYNFNETTSVSYRIATGVSDDDNRGFEFETNLYQSLYLSSKYPLYSLLDSVYLLGSIGFAYNDLSDGNLKGLAGEIGVGYPLNSNTDVKLTFEKMFEVSDDYSVNGDFSSLSLTLSYSF